MDDRDAPALSSTSPTRSGWETKPAPPSCGSELFGFNTGNYEEKLVDGGKRHSSGIAWRLKSDLDLVAHEKKLMPLCQFLHESAANGIADVTVTDHDLSAKLHPAAP